MKKTLLSFKYAFRGIYKTLKSETNMKIHFIAVIVVICFGVIYKISAIEWMICIILFGLVISSELINTAIEYTVDLVTQTENPLAKLAKDASARSRII